MISAKFLMGRGRSLLSREERSALENGISCVREVPARQVLIRSGEPLYTSMLLLEGLVCRYIDGREGRRQLVGLSVPGDFVDLQGFTLKHLDHDVATIGPIKIAVYDHKMLTHITEQVPGLNRLLWFSTLLDAAIHREWIFRIGRLGAEGQIAHLLCELAARLDMVGLVRGGGFELPMTQSDLAEASGLTSVHVNRVLRTLRERKLLEFNHRQVRINDREALERVADFDRDYLYPSD